MVLVVYQIEINDVLLFVFVYVFCVWIGQYSIVLILEGYGCEDLFDDVDLFCIVGWFILMYLVSLVLEYGVDLVVDFKVVKEQLWCIFGKGIGFGMLCYFVVGVGCLLCFGVYVDIGFNYLGQFDVGIFGSVDCWLCLVDVLIGVLYVLGQDCVYLLDIIVVVIG